MTDGPLIHAEQPPGNRWLRWPFKIDGIPVLMVSVGAGGALIIPLRRPGKPRQRCCERA
jgi:hypothetical protein